MELIGLFKRHFSTSNTGDTQIFENQIARDCAGLSGLSLLSTAAIGYLFFEMQFKSGAVVGSAGLACLTSYFTKKDGYVLLAAAAALAALAAVGVEMINSERVSIVIHLDASDLIPMIEGQSGPAYPIPILV